MGEFKRSAVYVKEQASVPPPPVAGPTPLGIVGFTLKGPSNQALLIESFDDFRAQFGDFTPLSLVPLEVEKAFNNGAQVIYIVRVTPVGSITAGGRFEGDDVILRIARGDGAQVNFTGILMNAPVSAGTLELTSTDALGGPISVTDDGFGRLIGDVATIGVNYIDYLTGEYDVMFDIAPAGSATVNLTNDGVGTAGNQLIIENVAAPGFTTTGMGGGAFNAPATGTITTVAGAALVGGPGGDNFILKDGTNTVTFEFDTGGGVTPGNTSIPVTALLTAIEVAAAIRTAINGVGTGLLITAEVAGAAVNAAFTRSRWEFAASSEGAWGNGIQVEVQGGDNFKKQEMFDKLGPNTTYLKGNNTVGPYQFTIPGAPLIPGAVMITAADKMAYDDGTGTFLGDVPAMLTIVNDNVGAMGNILITDTVADPGFIHTGMAGGAPAVNAIGTITAIAGNAIADGEQFVLADGINLSATTFEFDKNGAVTPGTVAVTINNGMTSQQVAAAIRTAVNGVGAGLLVSVSFDSGTVNYETGAVTVNFSAAIPTGAIVRAHQNGFSLFDVSVLELQPDGSYLVQEVFDALDFIDPNSDNYVPTVINDTAGGSVYIAVSAGQGGIIPAVQRVAWRETPPTFSVGNGITRRFQGTLAKVPVDPFSVKVVVASPYQEALDDGVGFLTGANLDPFGVNQITYADGTIDFTFKVPPAVGQQVKVIYAQLADSTTINFTDGSDGTGVLSSGQIANPLLEVEKKGVYAFNIIEQPLNVIVPDFAENAAVTQQLVSYAETKRDRFIIACTSRGLTPTEAANFVRRDIHSRSSFVAVYYPWLRTTDRSIGRVRTVPPLGHVGGMYTKVDRTRSEGKAPAGTVDGLLFDVDGVERILEPQDENLIYPLHVNPILLVDGIGTYVNGCRTLSVDKDFQYISTRRLFIGFRRRALNDLRYALHEPVGPSLYSRVESTLTGIAMEYFQKGALAGTNPREAFRITVADINTPELADAATVLARVELAPAKPAEFIVVELSVLQRERAISVTV